LFWLPTFDCFKRKWKSVWIWIQSGLFDKSNSKIGQLGNGDSTNKLVITSSFQGALSVVDIACGLHSSFIIQSQYSCFGKNNTNSQICSANGICTGSNQCSCEDGYFGNECQYTSCFGKFNNQTNVCSRNGNCTELNVCSCYSNYGGKNCEVYLEPTNVLYSFGWNFVTFI
jgi:hypothetical protein